MSDSQATFEDLLIDEEEISENLLSETLIDYVRIGQDSGNVIPQEPFEDLTNQQKLTIMLLAQHALTELDFTEEAWLTPSAIAKRSGMKKGSVYPTVRDLNEDGIAESDNGAYQIPVHNLEAAKRILPQEDA